MLAHVGRPALIERLHIHIDKPFKQLVRVFLAVPQAEYATHFFRPVVGCNVLHDGMTLLVGEKYIANAPGCVHRFYGNEPVR